MSGDFLGMEQEMLAFVVGGVQIYVNSTFVTANLVAGNPKYGLASALHLLATNIWQVLSHRRCGPRTITAIQPVVLYILSAIKILREYERGVISAWVGYCRTLKDRD